MKKNDGLFDKLWYDILKISWQLHIIIMIDSSILKNDKWKLVIHENSNILKGAYICGVRAAHWIIEKGKKESVRVAKSCMVLTSAAR